MIRSCTFAAVLLLSSSLAWAGTGFCDKEESPKDAMHCLTAGNSSAENTLTFLVQDETTLERDLLSACTMAGSCDVEFSSLQCENALSQFVCHISYKDQN